MQYELKEFQDGSRQLIVYYTGTDWDKVIEQAKVFGWNYAVERALSLAIRYFSTPVPNTVFVDLQKSRSEDDAAFERAVRIQGKGSRWELTLMELRRRTFAEKVDWVRRILFPSRSYMRIRYRLRPNQGAWLFYLYRWFDQGREISWAIWNRLLRKLHSGE